ncbi:MAG: hypothetical protein NC432_15170, partial [Roseburia sp.]|nr:hypothetical protein [Roseburia sp.]
MGNEMIPGTCILRMMNAAQNDKSDRDFLILFYGISQQPCCSAAGLLTLAAFAKCSCKHGT